ncbi:MAG: hypothetical protein IH605_06965, partial [Burkholderiales bacterium]|nr:hypothetical protein [Burkholderiales bacterium]
FDNRGIPTKASLHELDLACVAEDLEQRGIIESEEALARTEGEAAGRVLQAEGVS